MYPLSTGVPSTVFTRVPDKHRRLVRTAWADANRGGEPVDCFLEGPSFDRAGNLYVVDIPFGRVFRVSPDGEWAVVTEYDGWPNGLKIHRDGRIFITDYKRGIMLLDPASGQVTPLIETVRSESFKGVNDLIFAGNGDLYFTDQGQTGLHDPTGRVCSRGQGRWRPRREDGARPRPVPRGPPAPRRASSDARVLVRRRSRDASVPDQFVAEAVAARQIRRAPLSILSATIAAPARNMHASAYAAP